MKRLLFPLLLLMAVTYSFAAITQTGYVKTRGRLGSNGRVIPGKRLASAVIELQNGSSAKSDQSGDFSLTLSANKYFLRNVKKVGYVISDPDVLSKQYACSSNPLVLVLDEPSAMQDDKYASERKLRRDLQRKLEQREEELDALKKENKITQEQYREALQKLYSDAESNEKFISEMAERYSKIDFDQLDEFQRRMAEFIQNGELVKADSLLRTKGSMSEREKEIKRILSANAEEEKELAEREKKLSDSKKTAEVLLADYAADCYSRFELCKLNFDNDSAAYWLEKRAELFPENIKYQLEAGVFISDYLSKYNLALEYYNRALFHAKEKYGENHPAVATIYNNIGLVYADKGDYSRALAHYEKSLKIKLGIYGENYPDVATSYNNIGFVYSIQGDYSRALEYYEKSLKIWLGIYGENHPDVATSYNNVGVVYSRQGDNSRALETYEKSLKIELGIYGENHPAVATSYNNIGVVYSTQGDYSRALEYYEKALKIRLGIYGENHPAVNNIKGK